MSKQRDLLASMPVSDQLRLLHGCQDDMDEDIDDIRILLHELKEAIKTIGKWATGDVFQFVSEGHDEEKYDIDDVKERVEGRKRREELKKANSDKLPLAQPVLRRQ